MLNKLRSNKLIALFLSLVMAMGITPFSAFSNSETSKTFVQDGYTVTYEITNSWVDGQAITRQQIGITITNTGTSPIENWRLYYDFKGEIEQIWSATVQVDESGNTYIDNMGWNSTIWGGSSVEFGYTLRSDGGLPDSISMNLETGSDEPTETILPDGEKDSVIGYAYFKDIAGLSDLDYTDDGICFVRNQILITAFDNISFAEVAEIANDLNADIVGYIELTNDYQIEFIINPQTKI